MARSVLFFYICVNAAKILHNRMFGAVLRAPIRFFDTNPIGKEVAKFRACSTRIKTGQTIDDVMQTRGLRACPPGKCLKFRCSVSTFGAILGPSTLQ